MIVGGRSAASIVRPVAWTMNPAESRAMAAPRPTPRRAPVTSATAMSVLPHHSDDDALDLYLIGIDEDGLHRGVGRLQADLVARVAVELLERDVGAADQRDHHLAVVGGLAILDHDEVAVADLLVDHRIAADAENIRVALADEVLGHGERFVRGDCFDRQAGRDVAEQRQLDRTTAGARRHHLDRTAAVPGPLDEPFFLQVGEMLVHRGQRRQTELPPDFFKTRRVAVLSNEFVQVVQDLALTLGQWKHWSLSSAEAFALQAKVIYAKRRRRSRLRAMTAVPESRQIAS